MRNESDATGTPGTRAVFTTTLAVLAAGLIVMLALPLLGR